MDDQTEKVDTQFFIDELARISNEQDRRYANLSKRLNAIEDSHRGHSAYAEDPSQYIMGFLAVMLVLEVGLPLISGLVQRWCSSSSESSA